MPIAPGFALVPKVATQEERLDADARPTNVLASAVACADEVAESLVQSVGDPHIGELPGTMKASKGDRIPSVVLGPLTWLARGKGRRADTASKAERGQLPLNVVVTRPSLVDELN
jgi:hypothetical protein